MTYRVIRELGGEGMHFACEPGDTTCKPKDFATVDEAVKFALDDSWGSKVYIVKMVDWCAGERAA